MDIRIHAGNLKTGSTSIQGFLRQNLAALNASGQIYIPALTQNPAAHATLARQLGAEESLREKNRTGIKSGTRSLLRRLRQCRSC